MDFKNIIIDFVTSCVIVLRRFNLLIFLPYKTMRKISKENDYEQLFFLYLLVYVYFYGAYRIRPTDVIPLVSFISFFGLFIITVSFFYLFSRMFSKDIRVSSFVFTLSYSLFPTLIWFITNSLFYYFLPPPRTLSILGKAFSIFFIAFSISLLVWKLILIYCAIRFSSKFGFYRIMYSFILYLCLLIPASLLLYQLNIFRIPFI